MAVRPAAVDLEVRHLRSFTWQRPAARGRAPGFLASACRTPLLPGKTCWPSLISILSRSGCSDTTSSASVTRRGEPAGPWPERADRAVSTPLAARIVAVRLREGSALQAAARRVLSPSRSADAPRWQLETILGVQLARAQQPRRIWAVRRAEPASRTRRSSTLAVNGPRPRSAARNPARDLHPRARGMTSWAAASPPPKSPTRDTPRSPSTGAGARPRPRSPPADRPPRPRHEHQPRGRPSCSRWRYHAVFTDSPFETIRPTNITATTPSSSRSADWATGPSLTCRRAPRRQPAWLACAASAATSGAAGALASCTYAGPAAPPSAATASPSRPVPPATAAATSPCTCPKAGTTTGCG